MTSGKTYQIEKLTSRLKYKEVLLNDGKRMTLPYSTCIDKDCELTEKQSSLSVKCRNGIAKIFPTYCQKDQINFGGFSMDLLIKEITDDNELLSYQSLAKYHYKDKDLFGRTSIIIAVNTAPYLPKVIGYIELATPFYVNKPRAKILNSPFEHNGISWEAWDKETTRTYINVIVRIARCVVYPEFRGVGLGQMLIKHAEKFAKDRWQISKFKPLFLEISADMLRYIPFAEKAGMHYVGDTQGNLDRIHKDLSYLLSNYRRIQSKEIVGKHQIGIVEQQKSRLRKAIKLAEQHGLTIEEFIDRLERLQKDRRLKDFTFFNGLVSLPKPTYLKGLDGIAESFIINQIGNSEQRENNFFKKIRPNPIERPIELNEISISFSSKIRRTRKTQAIQNAFGISPSDIENPIIKDLTLQIKPGEIVLVIGSSGAGKTTLLNLLTGKIKNTEQVTVKGDFVKPLNYKPGEFREVRSKKPLVDYFGNESIDYVLQLLGSVGLSDAHVFVKRFDELSNGQKYRALMAMLIHSKSNVLVVDEFCANLDPITANVLAHRTHKLTKKLGLTMILGAAHCDSFVRSLQPDKVVRLSTAWDYDIIDGKIFAKRYKRKDLKLAIRPINLKKEYFNAVIRGVKSTTIRKYNPAYKKGFALLKSKGRLLPVYIEEIETKAFSEINEEDARKDGFPTLSALRKALKQIYGALEYKDRLTILNFKLLDFK